MTVGSVPPPLALGNVAAAQPGAVAAVVSAGAGTAGSAQPGITPPAAQETTPSSPLAPQIAAGSALDALVLKAAAQAALGEGGLALLMADLSQVQSAPALPAPVQAAITQVLALRAPIDTPPTGADLKTALAQTNSPGSPSPLSTSPASPDAALAAALASGGPLKNALVGLQQTLKTWLASVPVPSSPAAPAAAAADSAPRQLGTPPLVIANLAQAVRASGLPAPVQAALLQALTSLAAPTGPSAMPPPSEPSATPVLAQGLPAPAAAPTLPNAPVEPTTLSADLNLAPPAVIDTGAPASPDDALPAPASSPAAGSAAPEVTITTPDVATLAPAAIKAALATLQAMAPAPTGVTPVAPGAEAAAPLPAIANAVAASVLVALPATIDPKEAMVVFQQVFNAWLDEGSMPASAPLFAAGSAQATPPTAGSPRTAPLPGQPASNAPTATNAPPPPYRGGPTTAQPAVPSTLAANADPSTLGARLLRETSAALAHQELLQIASLPAAMQGPAASSSQSQQWMFEIPFATAQGTAIAQFKITRDGGKGRDKGGKQAPVWRARFSLDVEPMGPVHAQIVLSGDRTWVSLWAEREESVARLRQHEGLLTSSLQDSNFSAEVAFHTGAPRQPATSSGQFLNRAS